MKQYLDLMRHIRENGVYKEDRTGTGVYSVFGAQMRFDLSKGQFPLVTTKTCHLRSIIHELLWFLKGDTNIRYLKENGVSIWDEWVKQGTEEHRTLTLTERAQCLGRHRQGEWTAFMSQFYDHSPEKLLDPQPLTEEQEAAAHAFLDERGVPTTELIGGELGPVYGAQWRSWPNPVVHKEVNKVPDLKECIKLLFFNKKFDALDEIPRRFLKEGVEAFSLQESDTIVTIQERIEASCDIQLVTADMVEFLEGWGLWHRYGRERIVHEGIDQIKQVVETLISNPDSRRIIVSAWNPALVDQMALPPCHALFQFYSAPMSVEERVDYANYQTDEAERRYNEAWEGVMNTEMVSWRHLSKESLYGWTDRTIPREEFTDEHCHTVLDRFDVPRRKLSCQLYQRKHHCAFLA